MPDCEVDHHQMQVVSKNRWTLPHRMRRPETTFLSIGQKFPGDAFSMNLIDMVIPTNPAF
jgi:hypothetical protein